MGLKTAAFVTCTIKCIWPLPTNEGLPTPELHRELSQCTTKHHIAMELDDIS